MLFRSGRPRLEQLEVVDGRDTYTIVDVPMKPEVTSVENKLRAVLIVARSERRLESRACFKSSAGLRVITTTTERIATRARTTRSSMRVKELRLSFRPPSRNPEALNAWMPDRVRHDRLDWLLFV